MASDRQRNDVEYAMAPFKLLMWPLGIWPLQVYDVYSLIRCVFATCCMIVMVIVLFLEIGMGCTDAEQNIDSLMLISCGFLGILKTICSRVYANNLTDNYSSAVNDYLTAENAEKRAIVRRHAFIGRTICTMVYAAYFDSCIYAIIPFLNDQSGNINDSVVLIYTMPSRCVLDHFNVPRSMFKIVCLIELFILMVGSTGNFGNDSLFLNITLHVCGQMKILNANMVNFDVANPKIHDHFVALIQKHNHLINMAKKIADTISIVLLMQLFLSSVLLCIVGFQFILALKINNFMMMMKSFMVLSTVLVQLSLYSFVGDYLIFQMEEVGLSIYRSVWYNFPANITKNFNFVIMRAQSPVKLQAGNFFVLNLSNYMSILKTSISYLSVLRMMVET